MKIFDNIWEELEWEVFEEEKEKNYHIMSI